MAAVFGFKSGRRSGQAGEGTHASFDHFPLRKQNLPSWHLRCGPHKNWRQTNEVNSNKAMASQSGRRIYENEPETHGLSMKISQKHEQLPSACGGPNNPRTRDLRNSLRSFGSHPVSQPFSPASGRALSDSGLNQVIHLSRIVESISCSAAIEERNRLAREIHDTLVQEFAGILLHLEAANGSELALNASECLARARELAKSGLEDARRMLLGLRPKSLEGADLSDALVQLAERFRATAELIADSTQPDGRTS